MIDATPENAKFVLLQTTPEVSEKTWWGEPIIQKFFSCFTLGNDPTKSAEGETWYQIIGYAQTVEEAQTKLYGRSFKL